VWTGRVANLNAQIAELEELYDELLQDYDSLEDELTLTKEEVDEGRRVSVQELRLREEEEGYSSDDH